MMISLLLLFLLLLQIVYSVNNNNNNNKIGHKDNETNYCFLLTFKAKFYLYRKTFIYLSKLKFINFYNPLSINNCYLLWEIYSNVISS